MRVLSDLSGTWICENSRISVLRNFREILRYARAYESQSGFTVVAHPAVIDRLLTAEAPAVADLEHFINRVIKFQVENLYTQEQYDIILS